MRFFYFIVTIFDFLSSDVGMNKWSNPFSILASIFDMMVLNTNRDYYRNSTKFVYKIINKYT